VTVTNKDIKAMVAARKQGRLRPGVPQTDPVAAALAAEAAAAAPATPPEPPAPPVVPAPVAVIPSATPTPAAAPGRRLLELTRVDRSELPHNRGFQMYPSRHQQLLDMAFSEGRKPWQIIDDALEAYVQQHHGELQPGPPPAG
jgi:hypothetical protein